MEAKELRIGNWIYLVDKKKNYQIDDGHDIDECDDNPLVKPIQLTEEWLLKCGFIKTYPDGENEFPYWIADGVEFCDFLDGDYEINATGLIFKYLHHLQNLYFALTGKELKIKES